MHLSILVSLLVIQINARCLFLTISSKLQQVYIQVYSCKAFHGWINTLCLTDFYMEMSEGVSLLRTAQSLLTGRTISGLIIKPVLPYRQNLKKVQNYLPQKLSKYILPRKWNAAGPQQLTKHKRLPSVLTHKVGHPCRLRFSWLHEQSVPDLL